jgi:hypothetical protein
LILSARKFFFLNPDCSRRIFCERLPGLAPPYAHKTLRLNELLTRLGAALGGRPGARMALGIGIKIGRDALLARVRCAQTAQSNVEINRLLRKGEAKLSPEKDRLLDLLSTLNDHSCWVISHVLLCWTYSARSATIGSTFAARAAGIQDARSAAAQSDNVAMVSMRGSHGETPKS